MERSSSLAFAWRAGAALREGRIFPVLHNPLSVVLDASSQGKESIRKRFDTFNQITPFRPPLQIPFQSIRGTLTDEVLGGALEGSAQFPVVNIPVLMHVYTCLNPRTEQRSCPAGYVYPLGLLPLDG